MSEVKPIKDRQVSLFSIDDYEDRVGEEWGWFDGRNSELGTNILPVPNSDNCELGTNILPVPNSDRSELGTNIHSVPNCDQWKPPIGCLQQKWIKDRQYWYWRYYDNRRKKRSLYLGRDYNKAILKAQKIGIPADAKNGHQYPP
jgi:hypothetical protein